MDDDIQDAIDNAPDATRDPGVIIATVDYLSGLDSLEYEQQRKSKAKELGVRASALDKAVNSQRKKDNPDAKGKAMDLRSPEPWPDPINGVELLDGLTAGFCHYLALGKGAAEALALWTVHAHAFDAAQISPRLAVTSPEKRCGKTTVLKVLYQLVPKPLPAANITSAALFRVVEAAKPTLLIDEADTFLRDSDELRGILNSGHDRETAYVLRVVGDDHEPRQFHTWAPTAIAMIGKLPDTLEDRSIPIEMRRKRKDESVERFRADRSDFLKELGRKAARWTADNINALRDADPDVPDSLHDRAADNWRALLAIADHVGGDWPQVARNVALKLTDVDSDDGSAKTLLLMDMKAMFEDFGRDRLFTSEILERLHKMDDRPWPEWRKGKPITSRQLSQLLKPFNIKSVSVRDGHDTAKGYHLDAFNDAFARYIPSQSVTASQVNETVAYSDNLSVTSPPVVTDRNGLKPVENIGCDAVTDKKGGNGGTHELFDKKGDKAEDWGLEL